MTRGCRLVVLLLGLLMGLGAMIAPHRWATAASRAGRSGSLPAAPDRDHAVARQAASTSGILLPFCLQPIHRNGSPMPTPRATASQAATSAPTETTAPSVTPSPTATRTPRPLSERISQRTIALEARVAQEMGVWTSYPIVSAPRYDGSQLIGWSTSSGQVRITPLDAGRSREAADIAFGGQSIHGLVAHPDGGAALYAAGDEMRLRRFDGRGNVVFEQALVGTGGHGREGDKWIDDWSHEGRLGWTGELYVAYFGHTQNWGGRGNHQGDLLWLFDADGRRVEGQSVPGYYPNWDWGCSHSIDVRLSYNQASDSLGPVCLSDEFPQDGVIWSNSVLIASMPGDGGGHVQGQLGGLVTTGRGFSLTYVTRTDRKSYDVALAAVDEWGHSSYEAWLTDTPGVDETSAHLARYGDNLLAAWRSGSALQLAVIDVDGNVLDGPHPVSLGVGLRDDFFNYPDGRPGWTYAAADRQSLVSVAIELP